MKVKKNIKKSFYDVKAPMISNKIQLYAGSPEELDGKTVKIDMTRSLKGKSFELKFKIKNNNGVLEAKPVSMWLAGSYVRKSMRGGIDYVEDSFNAECRDVACTIKPFMITRNKVSRSVRNSLRIEAKRFLEGHLKSRTSDELFDDLITNKLQRAMSLKLKKIYPLAMCEVRVFELAQNDKAVAAPAA